MKNFIIIIALIFPVVLASCSEDSSTNGKSTEIKVGVLLTLTGDGSSLGETAQAGLEIAKDEIAQHVKDINTDYSFTLMIEDTESDTAKALQKLRYFASQGIDIVIGPQTSAEAAHCKAFADSNSILLVSPTSVATSLAIPDDNLYRLTPSDAKQAEAVTKMMVEDGKKYIVAIVRDDVWGNDLINSAESYLDDRGGRMHHIEYYQPGTADYSDEIFQIERYVEDATDIDGNSDVVGVYMVSFAEGGDILEQSAGGEWASKVKWYGSSAFAENKALLENHNAAEFAANVRGLPCPVFGFVESAKNKWEPIAEQIENAVGRPADMYSLCAYDAFWIVAKTWLAADLPADIESLRGHLVDQAATYSGATGNTTFNAAGDRAEANYDFWGIEDDGGYKWVKVATYDTKSGILTRY
jgi:branched-chain amino acid transport system substrate-binding protein